MLAIVHSPDNTHHLYGVNTPGVVPVAVGCGSGREGYATAVGGGLAQWWEKWWRDAKGKKESVKIRGKWWQLRLK